MSDPHVISVAVTDRIPVFELAVPCEVFGIDRSDIVKPWYDFRLCAAEPGPLRTTAGLTVDTEHGLRDLLDADTILVPACSRAVQVAPPDELLDVLREAHGRGTRLVSICTGVYLLAAAGLLDGRRATAHWMNAIDFAYRFPAVQLDPAVLYVDEGDILTSAGVAAGLDLCLYVVRGDCGSEIANRAARRCVVPPLREGGQAQFIERHLPEPGDDGTAAARAWALTRLDRPLDVASLARHARMSTRTFARRFTAETGMTPARWLTQQRLDYARQLLETTDLPVERIAAQAGLGTATTLRQQMRTHLGVAPLAYRKTFRAS